MIKTDKEEQVKMLFERYTEAVFPSREKALAMILGERPLVFYLGIDPTGPDIHLGNATNLLVLKKLQSWGHRIILLIGDFTAQTGDPSEKEATRRVLTEKKVEENMQTYLDQVHKILKPGSFEVKYNSAWLNKMSLADLRLITRQFTVQQMIIREMFQKRLKEQKPITLEEFLYPLMQGYDSVAMQVDGEVGGTDQTFNMLVGRELVSSLLRKEKIVVTTKLLEDPVTGRKIMNKSEGRYVALNDDPREMFGKVMAIPDHFIVPLYKLTTEAADEKINEAEERLSKKENPKNLKLELAFEIVALYHGPKEAEKAREEFEKVFSKKELPEEMPVFKVTGEMTTLALLGEWLKISKAEAKRLVEQGAVKVGEEVVRDWHYKISAGVVVRVGPHRFLKTV